MNLNIAKFRRQFDSTWFHDFRKSYESINPDRPLETADIAFDQTAPHLREWLTGDPEVAALAAEFLPQLGMFLQGPFPLPNNATTPSAWDCRTKIDSYRACGLVPETVRGKRCLDVGCNAGYDPFLLSSLGASEVVGAEPHGFYFHALFLSAIYNRPGVSFINLGWEDLDPHYLRDFDWVTCLGLLYHVRDPLQLIDNLAAVMHPGARLLLETHVLSESSNQALFIEDKFWGDETYWWIHGDECLKSMLRSSGFKDVEIKHKGDCDSRNPADPTRTVEGYPAGARAWVTAIRR